MPYWRVHSKARSHRVAIEGQYRGASAYLVGGSPRLLDLDLRLLRLPGCWTMAINNAAVIFEPDCFIALDTARCFNFNVFSNPRILKLINYSRHDEMISGRRLSHYPNTLFFNLDDEVKSPMWEFCRLDGPLPFWRNTFFTALAALYQLGFRQVFLIGCTFETNIGSYAHQGEIRDSDRTANQELYDDTVDKLRQLVPMVRDEGMSISTCHPDSPLDGVVPYVPFEESVSRVVIDSTSVEFNDYKHVSQTD
mgnify:CR=1 FL=1